MHKKTKKKVQTESEMRFILKPERCYDISTVNGRVTEVEVDINSDRLDGVRRVARYEDHEFDVPENVYFLILKAATS